MNVALIFAGGSGSRMNSKAVPKQFLVLSGRAIIIHTLEYFDSHPEIDSICVVCIESWIGYLKGLLQKHGIQKVRWIVPGGSTGQESIYNGVKVLHDAGIPDDSVVLVHDGVRPLISEQLISDCIQCTLQNENAITVAPAIKLLFVQMTIIKLLIFIIEIDVIWRVRLNVLKWAIFTGRTKIPI